MSETSDPTVIPGDLPADAAEGITTGDAVLEEARTEAARERERHRRTLADFDNFRRRAQRDREDACAAAIGAVLEDVLPALDGLTLAGEAARQGGGGAVASGIDLVRERLAAALGRHGVETLAPTEGTFNPAEHEAVAHLPSATVPEGGIVQLVRAGYRVGRRIVRPAAVVVSRGAAEATGD